MPWWSYDTTVMWQGFLHRSLSYWKNHYFHLCCTIVFNYSGDNKTFSLVTSLFGWTHWQEINAPPSTSSHPGTACLPWVLSRGGESASTTEPWPGHLHTSLVWGSGEHLTQSGMSQYGHLKSIHQTRIYKIQCSAIITVINFYTQYSL